MMRDSISKTKNFWDLPYLVKTKKYNNRFLKVEKWLFGLFPVEFDIISLRHLEEVINDPLHPWKNDTSTPKETPK